MIDKANVTTDGQVDPKLGDEIPENYITKAIAELKAGYRLCKTLRQGEPFVVKITHPSLGQEMELARVYTDKYNELLSTKGYRTRKQLEKELRDRGSITAFEDKKIEEISKSLTKAIEEYNFAIADNTKTEEELEVLRKEYYSTRDKLFALHGEKSAHFINSIESICEQIQGFHKMVFCIKDESGNKIWNNIDELLNETDRGFLSDMISESQMFWSGLSKEVLDLPRVLDSMRGESLEKSPEILSQLTSL
jgi:hypothetical protein